MTAATAAVACPSAAAPVHLERPPQQRHEYEHHAWADYLEAQHPGVSRLACPASVELTGRHSRSLTVYEALLRLSALPLPSSATCAASLTDTSTDGAAAHHQPCCSERGDTDGHGGTAAAAGAAGVEAAAAPAAAAAPRLLAAMGELRVTVAGADRNEGCDAVETAAVFSELVRLVEAAGVRRLRLLLCGPSVSPLMEGQTFVWPAAPAPAAAAGSTAPPALASEPASASATQPYGLHAALAAAAAGEGAGAGAGTAAPAPGAAVPSTTGGDTMTLRVAYCPGLFHDQATAAAGPGAEAADLDTPEQPPHLVVCFNAGGRNNASPLAPPSTHPPPVWLSALPTRRHCGGGRGCAHCSQSPADPHDLHVECPYRTCTSVSPSCCHLIHYSFPLQPKALAYRPLPTELSRWRYAARPHHKVHCLSVMARSGPSLPLCCSPETIRKKIVIVCIVIVFNAALRLFLQKPAPSHPQTLAHWRAGAWGYGTSWSQSFQHATASLRSPVVITSYSWCVHGGGGAKGAGGCDWVRGRPLQVWVRVKVQG